MSEVKIKAKCKGVIRLLNVPKDVSYKDFYELVRVELYKCR